MSEITTTCPKGMCEFCRKEHKDLIMTKLFGSELLNYYIGKCPETGGRLEMFVLTDKGRSRKWT